MTIARCVFENRGGKMVCGYCGRVVPIRDKTLEPSQYHANCGSTLERATEPPSVCIHFGEATGEIALIQCVTCQGNVRQKFPIHECAIFGKCLPTYSGVVDDGHGCIGCDRREVLPQTE